MGIFYCVLVDVFWDFIVGGYCVIEDKKFFFGIIFVYVMIDIVILILFMWEIGYL